MNKIETPFDPFRNEEGKVELKFNLRAIGPQIEKEIVNSIGNKEYQLILMIYGSPSETPDKKFYLEEIYYEQLQNALSPFQNISSDARHLLYFLSLVPRFYKESFKEKANDFFVEQNALFSSMALKQDLEQNIGKNTDVIFRQISHTEGVLVSGKHFSKIWNLEPKALKLYYTMKASVARMHKGNDADPNEKFLEVLKIFGSMSESWQEKLPRESIIRDIVIFELDRIIRSEKLFPDIDLSKMTNTKITELIISLFQAVGYFEVDTGQDQLRMVNNAYHRYKDIISIR